MSKLLKHWKYKILKYWPYLIKRHFINQILTGRILKFFYLIMASLKYIILKTPRVAIIETANVCNISCPTCPTPHHKIIRPKKNMSLGEFRQIIDKISPYCHIVLLYNSNEPLLHPEIDKMIKYADQKNLYTMISTNATLLDQEMSDRILKSGLDEILLCLDGMSKESYEPFRTGADFETVKNNISRFCGMKKKQKLIKPFTELQFIVTKLNQDEIPLIKDFAKQIGIDRLRLKSLSLGEHAFTKEEMNDLTEKFFPDSKSVKVRYQKDSAGALHVKRPAGWACPIITRQLVVLTDGSVAMCCRDFNGQYLYGNILQDSFLTVWNSPKAKSLREKVLKNELLFCRICS
ncbi:radical SAM protein [Patescibacteria group bacterium]|nr:radical SAM protein [Patescibacteria group bacterium]